MVMLTEDKFLLLRNYDLWCQLSDEEYEELHLVHQFIEAKKGDYIYFDSHHLNKLYFLKGGYIKIGYIDEEGNEIIKEILNEGEVFGQFTLERNNKNGEFAQAHGGDVSLCAFTIDDFEKLLVKKPQLAVQFSKQVGKKLQQTEFRLVNMLNKDVRNRLIGFIYHTAVQNGYDGTATAYSFDNFLTHDDMARLIGSARQTVTTLLTKLDEEGLLTVTRQRIYIPDVKRLQKLAIVT